MILNNGDEPSRAYVVLKQAMITSAEEITIFINSRVPYIKGVSGAGSFFEGKIKNPSRKILRYVLRDCATISETLKVG